MGGRRTVNRRYASFEELLARRDPVRIAPELSPAELRERY
jgi:hypothetical protein